jgi:hypothetical protein
LFIEKFVSFSLDTQEYNSELEGFSGDVEEKQSTRYTRTDTVQHYILFGKHDGKRLKCKWRNYIKWDLE